MGDFIVIGILAVAIAAAILSGRKHFQGEGGCCGGGGGSLRDIKKLGAPKIGEKKLLIEGMHCENCRNRVEHAVNQIDGAVCRVSLRKKTAKVSYSREISDEAIRDAVEAAGYAVKEIRESLCVCGKAGPILD